VTFTIWSGEGTGRRRRSSRSKVEKIAVLTPMPSASESTATVVTSGLLANERIAYRTSWQSASIIVDSRSLILDSLLIGDC
jgi:hypothetical protein